MLQGYLKKFLCINALLSFSMLSLSAYADDYFSQNNNPYSNMNNPYQSDHPSHPYSAKNNPYNPPSIQNPQSNPFFFPYINPNNAQIQGAQENNQSNLQPNMASNPNHNYDPSKPPVLPLSPYHTNPYTPSYSYNNSPYNSSCYNNPADGSCH